VTAPPPTAQASPEQRSLSEVLDALEHSVEGDRTSVQHIIDRLGDRSFPAQMLIFSLISTSPASTIPGLTTAVALIVFLLAAQMIVGRDHAWLPRFITQRELKSRTLLRAIGWLRKPVRAVERYLRPRWSFLTHRPWRWVPLTLILILALAMPLMEFVPSTGSIASAAIALCAAGLLARDGVLIALSLLPLMGLPVAIYALGF